MEFICTVNNKYSIHFVNTNRSKSSIDVRSTRSDIILSRAPRKIYIALLNKIERS